MFSMRALQMVVLFLDGYPSFRLKPGRDCLSHCEPLLLPRAWQRCCLGRICTSSMLGHSGQGFGAMSDDMAYTNTRSH